MADEDDLVRLWLVERTYSDDELNLIILTYASTDGTRYLRKERALTSFSDDRPTTAAIEVSPERIGRVDDPDRRQRFAREANRMASKHEPADEIRGRKYGLKGVDGIPERVC